MFCPKCKYEYRDGFTECYDCKIPLVDSLEENNNSIIKEDFEIDPDIKYVEFLETEDLSDIAFIKSILDGENIQYFFRGENMKLIRPVDPVQLMVLEKDVDLVKDLLKDVKLNYFKFIFSKEE